MNTIRSHLGFKLFASYFLVIVIGMGTIWVATRFTVPSSYQRHLFSMEQNLGTGNGVGPMMGQGGGMMSQFYQEYQASFNESLIVAVLAATWVALIASFVISRTIVAPVRLMTKASGRIAEGRYEERVELKGNDELGQLAKSFNQMAEQLQQVESMRRQLIGDVAHELRTPLTSIKGSAEALIDGLLPATAETYQQIYSEAGRLSRLVDDLQELSRVESRTIQLDVYPVDSILLIQTVIKRLQVQFNEKRVSLISNLPHDPIHVLADEGRIIQVLTNLIGNALQHTPENRTVTVSVMRDKKEAIFSIIDTGDGISAEHLTRIFDRFYRVDKSRSRARGGSGVGLTIAKHLVESHGGKIWAESAGKNKGSEFMFTLPLAKN